MDTGSHRRPLCVQVGGETNWEEGGRVSSRRSEEWETDFEGRAKELPCGRTRSGMEAIRNQGELLGFWITHLNRSEHWGERWWEGPG